MLKKLCHCKLENSKFTANPIISLDDLLYYIKKANLLFNFESLYFLIIFKFLNQSLIIGKLNICNEFMNELIIFINFTHFQYCSFRLIICFCNILLATFAYQKSKP